MASHAQTSTAAHGHDAHGGGHGGGHGHVIVSLFTLRFVLAALLFFTLLTVGLAQLEVFIAHTFHVELPGWLNVVIALSIASVKTVLVVLFFMQLRYDNPMNSVIFIFTLLTVASFLGFTMIDLGQRRSIDVRKAQYVVEGGYGNLQMGVLKGQPQGVSIVEAARNAAKNAGTFDAAYYAHKLEKHAEGGSITDAGFRHAEPTEGSSINRSRPINGVTLPGLPGAPSGEKKAEKSHGGH